MKIIDLLNKIANGEVPKKIKVNDKFTYIHDGTDYKCADGTYLFDAYIATKTEDMNIKVEILDDEEKGLHEKLHTCYTDTDNEDIEFLIKNINDLVDKYNDLIDYLEKQSKGE